MSVPCISSKKIINPYRCCFFIDGPKNNGFHLIFFWIRAIQPFVKWRVVLSQKRKKRKKKKKVEGSYLDSLKPLVRTHQHWATTIFGFYLLKKKKNFGFYFILSGTYFYVIGISFDKTHFTCILVNLSRFKMIITSG